MNNDNDNEIETTDFEVEETEQEPTSKLEPFKAQIIDMRSKDMSYRTIEKQLQQRYGLTVNQSSIRYFYRRELDKKTELSSRYQEKIQENFLDDPVIIDEQIRDMKEHIGDLKRVLKEDCNKNRSYLEAQKVLKDWIVLRSKLGTPKQHEASKMSKEELDEKLAAIIARIKGERRSE